jgi:hypothetical protein
MIVSYNAIAVIIYNAANSQVLFDLGHFENKNIAYFEKRSILPMYYNADVLVVKFEFAGFASGILTRKYWKLEKSQLNLFRKQLID